MEQKNLEIAHQIHKYKVLWELNKKNPDVLIIQAAMDVVNSKQNIIQDDSRSFDNPENKEFMRKVILMHYQTLMNLSEIYKGIQ